MTNQKWAPLSFILLLILLIPSPPCPAQDQSPAPFIEKGNQLMEEGDPAGALESYTQGLTAFPQNRDLLLGAGKAAYQAGDPGISVSHLFLAVEVAPEDFEINLNLGRALRFQGQIVAQDLMTQNEGYMMIEDALKFQRKAAALDEKSAEPCLDLAQTLAFLGDMEQATNAVDQALEREPKNMDALLFKGDLAYMAYRNAGMEGETPDTLRVMWQEAHDLYMKAAEQDEESPQPYVGLAALYEADKKWKESAGAYKEALLRDTELFHGYNQLITIFRRDDVEDSLPEFIEEILAKVKKQYPRDKAKRATPLYYLGYARYLESDFEESITAYTQSAAINDQYKTGADYYISLANYELGNHDKSVKGLLESMKDDPEGLTYYMQNDSRFRDVALPSIKYLAFHCFQQGKLIDALNLNAQLLNVVDDDPSLYNDYALLCRDTGYYENSYEAYAKAVELDPSNPNYLNDAALILHYHLHRDLDLAVEMYERAIVEAQKQLQNEGAVEREMIRVALRDATNNLRLLKAGIIEDQEPGPNPAEEEAPDKEAGV